jgi:hypothetical protein
VAHVDNYKDKGLTLEELLERILEESAESMTLPQILDKLPESVVFHRKSVRALLLTGPWAISLGPGRYEHIDGTGLALEERSRLLDDVIERLPGEGEPVLCRDLLEPQAGAAPDPQASRSLAILWGLLHKDERVQCGPALMVALSGTPGAQRLLRQAVMEVIREHEVIHIRQLRLEITARYGHSGMEGVLRALLRECVDEGLVTRGPERVYALPKVER